MQTTTDIAALINSVRLTPAQVKALRMAAYAAAQPLEVAYGRTVRAVSW